MTSTPSTQFQKHFQEITRLGFNDEKISTMKQVKRIPYKTNLKKKNMEDGEKNEQKTSRNIKQKLERYKLRGKNTYS